MWALARAYSIFDIASLIHRRIGSEDDGTSSLRGRTQNLYNDRHFVVCVLLQLQLKATGTRQKRFRFAPFRKFCIIPLI